MKNLQTFTRRLKLMLNPMRSFDVDITGYYLGKNSAYKKALLTTIASGVGSPEENNPTRDSRNAILTRALKKPTVATVAISHPIMHIKKHNTTRQQETKQKLGMYNFAPKTPCKTRDSRRKKS